MSYQSKWNVHKKNCVSYIYTFIKTKIWFPEMIIYIINYFQIQLTPRKHIEVFKFYKSSILFKYSGIHILYFITLNIFLFQFEISIHHKWFKRREWISSASRTRPKKQILQNETRNLQDVIHISYFWKKSLIYSLFVISEF